MIRNLVERNVSRLKLQTDNHDEIVDLVTRVVGTATDHAVRDLLKRQGMPEPAAAEGPGDSSTDKADRTALRGGKRAKSTD